MSFEKPWGNYLLEKIVETIAPETISYFPQTIAWQIICIVLIIFIINKGYQSWKTYQANAYRREALFWLSQCSLSNEEDVRQLPALLRKTALLACQVNNNNHLTQSAELIITRRNEITQLSGNSWATWLDAHCTKTKFSHQTAALSFPLSSELLLNKLAYIAHIDLLDDQFNKALKLLSQQITLWIKYHDFPKNQLPSDLGGQP